MVITKSGKAVGPEAGVEVPARATGEERGSLKQSSSLTTKGAALVADARKQLNATQREELLKKHRLLTTPNSGSKFVGASPAVTLGTPSKVPSDTQGPQLIPRNLDAEMSQASASASASTGEPSNSELLAAVHALTSKFDKLATKDDLVKLKTEVTAEVHEQVSAAVAPVKTEVAQLRGKVQELEAQKGGGGSAVDALWRSVDRNDPAKKQVAVRGLTSSTTDQQLAELELLLPSLGETYRKEACNVLTGKDKKPLGVALVDLGSRTQAEALVKRVKGQKLKAGNSEVVVTAARSELNGKRNSNLREAKQKVEDSGLAGDKEVTLHYGNDRQVTVAGEVVYQQAKWGVGGSFLGAFSNLSL